MRKFDKEPNVSNVADYDSSILADPWELTGTFLQK